MKMELQAILEVLEEKENKAEQQLDGLDENATFYNYTIGRLTTLRELESMVQDLLDE